MEIFILLGRYGHSEFSAKGECSEQAITPEKSILLSVWYLANNETFRQICDRFAISISSAHRVLMRVLNFLLSLMQEYISWPTQERKAIISENFKAKQNIRNIIGAIDGSHVRINRPSEHEETYVNRKQYHSMIIQAVCDSSKLFTDICCGEPGSLHDARVLRRSNLFRRAQTPNYFGEYFLIGDSAYPALSWLVTPFKDNGNLTEQQKTFNFKLSSTRMVIEHAFGLLKCRFRRLNHINNFEVDICKKIIMACCILHNICIMHKDGTNIEAVYDDNNCNENEAEQLENVRAEQVAINRREQVFEEMFREDV